MGIQHHEPGTLEKRAESLRKMWKEGGELRIADTARIKEVSEMFTDGMSIGKIREKLNYTLNGTVAKYLRKAGFKIPYAKKTAKDHLFNKRKSIDSFYENMKLADVQDLEA